MSDNMFQVQRIQKKVNFQQILTSFWRWILESLWRKPSGMGENVQDSLKISKFLLTLKMKAVRLGHFKFRFEKFKKKLVLTNNSIIAYIGLWDHPQNPIFSTLGSMPDLDWDFYFHMNIKFVKNWHKIPQVVSLFRIELDLEECPILYFFYFLFPKFLFIYLEYLVLIQRWHLFPHGTTLYWDPAMRDGQLVRLILPENRGVFYHKWSITQIHFPTHKSTTFSSCLCLCLQPGICFDSQKGYGNTD